MSSVEAVQNSALKLNSTINEALPSIPAIPVTAETKNLSEILGKLKDELGKIKSTENNPAKINCENSLGKLENKGGEVKSQNTGGVQTFIQNYWKFIGIGLLLLLLVSYKKLKTLKFKKPIPFLKKSVDKSRQAPPVNYQHKDRSSPWRPPHRQQQQRQQQQQQNSQQQSAETPIIVQIPPPQTVSSPPPTQSVVVEEIMNEDIVEEQTHTEHVNDPNFEAL